MNVVNLISLQMLSIIRELTRSSIVLSCRFDKGIVPKSLKLIGQFQNA